MIPLIILMLRLQLMDQTLTVMEAENFTVPNAVPGARGWAPQSWAHSVKFLLPAAGLDKQVTLLHMETPAGGASADGWLPVAHTCTSEVELPAYSSRAALERQLRRALSDMASGGGFGEL